MPANEILDDTPQSCQSESHGRDKGFPLHHPGGPQVWPPRQPSAHPWHRAPYQQLWVQGRGLCRHSPLCSLHLQQFGKILDVEIIFNERGSKVGDAHGQHHTASPGEGVSGARLPSSAVTCSPLLSQGTLACSAPSGQPRHQLGRSCGSLCLALEGGEGSLCPITGSSCPSVSGCLCCIFPAFCAPLPDSSPSSWVILGPQPGPLAPAGTPVWALHLCTVAASPPAPALLIHPLSLSVPTPSLCLSLSLSFSFSPLLTGFWVCNF